MTFIPSVSYALNGKRGNRDDGESETFVTHALTSEGFDASEDGTGRGTPLVAAPLTKGSATGEGVNPPGRRQEDDVNLVAFHPTQDPISGSISHALGSKETGSVAVAISENQRGELLETEVAHQLTAGAGEPGQGYSAVREGASVRRLTPTECERLQGLPDGWTQLGETPDSRRYAALGDAVTATVGEWLGRRLAAA